MQDSQDKKGTTDNSSTNKSPVALREEATLAMWKKGGVFEQSLAKEAPKGEFIFYDGPPFATGTPHYGHMLPGTIKDVIPRFKTMQGYHVPRRWGWDCHGLPVENLVEKELGLKSKKDIEEYGIERFVEAARGSVMRYADVWREYIPRTGRFVDMEHDYRTMDPSYTESVWWAFKTLHDKGLIYEGFKAMHLCPRCGTTLSNFEVNQGYKDITDISVYVTFAMLDKSGKPTGTEFLAWTTTPWTLPGNAALAVGSHVDYVEVELSVGEKIWKLIVAKDRLKKVATLSGGEPKILRELKGNELVGKKYRPLFEYFSKDKSLKNHANGWQVVAADFVTTDDGTGIVHIAPAFGSDDYELSLKENLPFIQHVGPDGKFKPEVKDFVGQPVKPKDDHQKTDIEIIKYLAAIGSLYAKEKITHSYPHCWRCETPLLNYAASSWFVKVTDLKDKLVAENKKINWVPKEVGEYRFGNWLAGARDWAISRSRYWGAPIPVWRSVDGKEMKIIGSRAELIAALKPRNRYLIMRHGEAENNVKLIMSSLIETKHDLTENGRNQAKEAAHELKSKKVDLIFASPFMRTDETAKIVSKELGLEYKTDPRLGEIKAGIYEGKSTKEYRACFDQEHNHFTWAPQGGETYNDVRKRVGEFMEEIDTKYEGKTILIITHDSPAWLLVSSASGLSDNEAMKSKSVSFFFLQNAQVKEFTYVPLPHNHNYEFDAHRPYIDKVTIKDSKGRPMQRVLDVFDCWFESGAMPFAECGYTGQAIKDREHGSKNFEPKSGWFKKVQGYPANFIAEGLDQTRGWFYSMLVLGVALFGKSPYKNVIVNGLVLAEDGKKMSKSLKNYPDPSYMINKYGMDALRFFLISSSAVTAEDLRFSEKGVDDVLKKVVNKLDNVLSFYEMYATSGAKEKCDDDCQVELAQVIENSSNILDRWILARLNQTVHLVTDNLERFTLNSAIRPLGDFIDDLSVWYIRRSRDRFKSEDSADKKAALETTRFVLEITARVMAPFTPFIAEHVYSHVRKDGKAWASSVHLATWPQHYDSSNKDKVLIKDMQLVRDTVTAALEARLKAALKVRQPLASLSVADSSLVGREDLLSLIKDEVNVKEIKFDNQLKVGEVRLDTTLTKELKDEGLLRELIRAIQDARKQAGLIVGVKIAVVVKASQGLKEIADKHFAELERLTQVSQVDFAEEYATEDPSTWTVTIRK